MTKLKLLFTAALFYGLTSIHAQETFPRNDVKDNRSEAFAFTNATIVVDPSTTIENASLLIKNGKIENVGTGFSIPTGYTTIDLSGKYIYPSFIELHSNMGMPKQERTRGRRFGGPEQITSNTKGAYNSNEAIKSHFNASEHFEIDSKTATEMRKIGFGAILTHRSDGIARGTSSLVALNNSSENDAMLHHKVAAHYSLAKGSSRQNYPSSMMGYISLLRQTYLDAEWFDAQSPRPFTDQSLEAWIATQSLPQIFDGGNWLNVLRADKVGDEFGIQYIIKSGGDSYKRADLIKATNAALIVPVNFPDAYDVDDPLDAEGLSLEDMKHWELAPTNCGTLESKNIEFSITSAGLKKKNDLLQNVRVAIKHGLSHSKALSSLTTSPATMIDMQDRLGKIDDGFIANFLITSGPIFEEKSDILENWVQGKRHVIKEMAEDDFAGSFNLKIGNVSYDKTITGKPGKESVQIIVDDSTSIKVESKINEHLITLIFNNPADEKEKIRLSGWRHNNGWKGTGQLATGEWVDWTSFPNSQSPETNADTKKDRKKPAGSKKEREKENSDLGKVIYPFLAYGREQLPEQKTMLIKNATVWTNESEGILTDTDVLLQNGKIRQIGQNISAPGAEIIDATGKHLTSGIIDEHTHIGGGGNDRATNSSMVRIGDQINPEQSNIYRTLAGGVTAAQVLHGSANPVGGQSALIKLRWGESPENMKIKGADEFIKFALGENVKRSSNAQSVRYPQSRMGVEQVYVDGFTNAVEYERKWKEYNQLSSIQKKNTVQPRRDLVNEAMLEIVNSERFITCHSYVQSEINMLMKVAENFGFRVNTFTHILEGYKVADKMREHGVAASTFSDWWNYKWEVRYAIPYNAAIMHNEGVLTAINSDDANMGRRLNQEAAKAIKYGGVSEEDAWKMVTLNPAKMLHLDDRMGSIKVGKDADVVLWTHHPLSIYARAEKTIIDGKLYWDIAEDQEARNALRTERARLIQKMKGEKKKGRSMQRPNSKIQLEFHCDEDHYIGHTHEH